MSRKSILLSAGGTGGHLFPAEALAHELIARGWEVHLATDRRAERYAGEFPSEAIHVVRSATIGSKNPIALMRAFVALWTGFREASALIERLKPAAVVGFGGYPTLPPVYAAIRRGVPTIIHEQNAVMGRANKALAARVSAIAGGFLAASGQFANKIAVTGNPVRPAVLEAAAAKYEPCKPDKPFRLLVFGGSQGARAFSDIVPPAIAALDEGLRRRLRLTQQCRPEDLDRVTQAYRAARVNVELAAFFDDLPERIAASHLVIGRAGASTVAELAAIGRPAILVPLPGSLDQDQRANATVMANAGGGWLADEATLSPQSLATQIHNLLTSTDTLERAAVAARALGQPDAVERLADLVEQTAKDI